ncbi:MAG: hypothetical protein WC864_05685 [Ilumatobacteraceae bacterium]
MPTVREAELAETIDRVAGLDELRDETLRILEELRKGGLTSPKYNLASSYGVGLNHSIEVDQD